jgi:hypothetical protein
MLRHRGRQKQKAALCGAAFDAILINGSNQVNFIVARTHALQAQFGAPRGAPNGGQRVVCFRDVEQMRS